MYVKWYIQKYFVKIKISRSNELTKLMYRPHTKFIFCLAMILRLQLNVEKILLLKTKNRLSMKPTNMFP